MELEKQLVSFENAKRLKELHVDTETEFLWASHVRGEIFIQCSPKDEISKSTSILFNFPNLYTTYPAFTVAELGEMLPKYIFSAKLGNIKEWTCGAWSAGAPGSKQQERLPLIYGDTEADARATMLIYLVENNLYDPQNTQKT